MSYDFVVEISKLGDVYERKFGYCYWWNKWTWFGTC